MPRLPANVICMHISGLITFAIPSPAPSPTGVPSVADLLDWKAIVAGLVVLGVSSLFSKAARSFYSHLLRRFLKIGPWFADKWLRLKTPIDTRAVNAVNETNLTAQLVPTSPVIAEPAPPALPARWAITANWADLGHATLENLGPGSAKHVILDSPYDAMIVRDGYWESIPPKSSRTFRVEPAEWLASEEFFVRLSWQGDDGQKKTRDIVVHNLPS